MCYNLVTICIECNNYIDSATKPCANRRDVNLEGCLVGRCLKTGSVDGFPIKARQELVWQSTPVAVVAGEVGLYLHPIRLIMAACVWCHARSKPHYNGQPVPNEMEWQVRFVDKRLGTVELHYPRAVRNLRKTDYNWGKDDPNEYYAYFTEGQLERWSRKYDPPLSTTQRRRLVDTVDQQVQTGHDFIFIEEDVYSQVLDLELTLEEHHHILREEYSLTHFLKYLEERKEHEEREAIVAAADARHAERMANPTTAVPPMPLAFPPGQDQPPATGNLQRRSRPTPSGNRTNGPRYAAPAARPTGVQKATYHYGARAPAMSRNSAVLDRLADPTMTPVPSHPAPRCAVPETPESIFPALNAEANMQTYGGAADETAAASGTEDMLTSWAASAGTPREQLMDELLQSIGSGIPAPTVNTNQQPPAPFPEILPLNPPAPESNSLDLATMNRYFDFDLYRQSEPADQQQSPNPTPTPLTPSLESGSGSWDESSMDNMFDFNGFYQQDPSPPSSAGACNAKKDISTTDLNQDEEEYYNDIFGGGFDCSAPKHAGA